MKLTLAYWRTQQGGGIALILLATLAFASLDTATKHAGTLAPVLMLLWFRYLFQAVATLALRFPVQRRAMFQTGNPRFQALRGVLLLVTSVCSFLGLQYLPVGEFTAIVMLAPLVATALAAWLLKSHVSARRWVLMATGLTGTLLMAPVAALHWDTAALLAHWPWFMLLGFFGTFGHLMLIWAFQRAPAVVLTPYLYAQIAFATLFGWLFFRHVPDAWAWVGIAVIAASGVGNAVLSVYESRVG